MAAQTRIALVHATRVAINPVEHAASRLWPQATMLTILDESLVVDRAAATVPMNIINSRIVALARYAEQLDVSGILYTCSAFGEGITEAARTSSVPVHKPNEAMFEAALATGARVAMICTFPPSVADMEREFAEMTRHRNQKAHLESVIADGALAALQSGDDEKHNRLIAETAASVSDADVILLAQFSMAQAAPAVRSKTSIPVLTSPESAIEKLKSCVEAD